MKQRFFLSFLLVFVGSLHAVELTVEPLWEKSFYKLAALDKKNDVEQGVATVWTIHDYEQDRCYGVLERLLVEPEFQRLGLGKKLFSSAINLINSRAYVEYTRFLAYPLSGTLSARVFKKELATLKAFYERLGAIQERHENIYNLRKFGVYFSLDHEDEQCMARLLAMAKKEHKDSYIVERVKRRAKSYAATIFLPMSATRSIELAKIYYKTAQGSLKITGLSIQLLKKDISAATEEKLIVCIQNATKMREGSIRAALRQSFVADDIDFPVIYDFCAEPEYE